MRNESLICNNRGDFEVKPESAITEVDGTSGSDPVPVYDERYLCLQCSAPSCFYMSIATAPAFRLSAQVFITHVVRADPRCFAIDDHHYSVLATIYLETVVNTFAI